MLKREERREERRGWDFRRKRKGKLERKKGGRFLSEKQEEKKERVDLSLGSLIS